MRPVHQRLPKRPPAVVLQWIEYLRRSLKMRRVYRIQASEESLTRFGGFLALVGPTTDATATKVYSALVELLFSWRRVQGLAANLSHLPVTPEGLLRVAEAVLAAGKIEPVERANFPFNNFLEVASRLPDAAAYVDVCLKDGFTKIREIFHPNTFRVTAQRYRGVVGELADPSYRDQVRVKLKTIT